MKYKQMLSVLNDNRLVLLYVFILNILLLIPPALSPMFKKVFTDNILTDGITEWLTPLLILMAGTSFLAAAVKWLQKSCLLRLSNKIEVSGTGRYIWLLLSSPLKLFYSKDSYHLLAYADSPKKISKLLTRDVLDLLFNAICVVFYLIMMMRIDLLMSAIVVGLVILDFGISKLREFIADRLAPEDNTAPNARELTIHDERIGNSGLENIETFKSTASETFFFKRILGSKLAIINANKESDYEEASWPFEELPEIIFLNLLLLISAFRIMDRSMSIGTYLAFQAYASAFFLPLSEVLRVGDLFESFEKRLKSLYKELKTDEELPARDQICAGRDGKLEGFIEVKDVSFGYEEGQTVLSGINISAKPGQRVAIIGNSGAGKTTLIKLLQGLHEPDSGTVTIDGVEPSRLDSRLYADSIGCANQEITVFAASVRDNITMWDDEISDAEIYNAASDACIHMHIAALEGAYDHQLAEHGSNLSGGQIQRLEIARTFLRNPSVVFLDEATSAVDPDNRSLIEENLIKRGCTCISVTNVLTHMPSYDEIILLDKGKIIGRGRHDELMETSGFYASLYREEEAVTVSE